MIIPEKLTSVERALVAASKMDAPDARRVLMLICESGMTMDKPVPQEPTEGEKHFAKREKFIQRMDATCKRVIKYAKHETLRKIEKHFRESSIASGEGEGHPFRGNQYSEGISEVKWKDVSEQGRGKKLRTDDGLYEIRISHVGNWRGHTGQHKSLAWTISKRNEDGIYEDTGGAYHSLNEAKKAAQERTKEYGYHHIGYTVKERNAMR